MAKEEFCATGNTTLCDNREYVFAGFERHDNVLILAWQKTYVRTTLVIIL